MATVRAVETVKRGCVLVAVSIVLAGCRRERTDLSVCFAGDLLLDRGVRQHIMRSGPEALLTPVAAVLEKADFAIANLECPATAVSTPVTKEYVFRAEPEWLEAVRDAGFTHVGLANNHTIDQGRRGLCETAVNARRYGLAPLGFGRTHEEACGPVEIGRGGKRMAVFSSVLLPLENWMFLPDRPSVCQATARELAGSIRAYRKERPNVFIVVTLHWGAEYHSLPTSLQRRQAEQIVAAGADMIVGHHPHVVQSIAWVHDRPVLFSLGNFVFDQRRSDSSRGMLVEVWLSTRGEPQFYLRPYRIDGCVPVPMSPSEAREFKQFVLSLSDGVVLDDTTDGWRLLRR